MNRKEFLKLSLLGVSALAFRHPILASISGLNDTWSTDELLGKKRPTLIGNNFNLRKEAAAAFEKMRTAARKDGIEIYSMSSYRSFYRQQGIWNRKYTRYKAQGLSEAQIVSKIIEYSTYPGTSRHHWGTDLDVVDTKKTTPSDPLSARHFRKGGHYEKLHFWMLENASKYGFYLSYTNESSRKGFKYEPWHYSYKPEAVPMLKSYLNLDLKTLLKSTDTKGSKYFVEHCLDQYIKENIKDINPTLLP